VQIKQFNTRRLQRIILVAKIIHEKELVLPAPGAGEDYGRSTGDVPEAEQGQSLEFESPVVGANGPALQSNGQ
jgi:hypothetical protein